MGSARDLQKKILILEEMEIAVAGWRHEHGETAVEYRKAVAKANQLVSAGLSKVEAYAGPERIKEELRKLKRMMLKAERGLSKARDAVDAATPELMKKLGSLDGNGSVLQLIKKQ